MICADSSTLSGTQNKRIWRSPVTPPFSGWHRHCTLQWWEKIWGSHQGTLHMRALTLKEADHNHNLCKMTLIFDENHKFIKHLNNVNKNKHQISLKMSCLTVFFLCLFQVIMWCLKLNLDQCCKFWPVPDSEITELGWLQCLDACKA